MDMFITKKVSKRTIGIVLLVTCVTVIFLVRLSSCGFVTNSAESENVGVYSLIANSDEACIDFLGQFEIEVEKKPIEVEKVKIPAEFNATFEEYNNLQKKQGLDLEDFKEKECERRSYKVINYKEDVEVRANLLIYDGMVIGGDVCSVALDGFMHTFDENTPH